VGVDVVDTAGHAEQDDYSPFLSRNALVEIHGYVPVYDLTSRLSFSKIQALSDQLERLQGDSPVPRILVGCMLDLCAEREVGKEERRRLAKLLGNIPFVEVSSKHNINVGEAFGLLLAEVEKEEAGEGWGGGRGMGRRSNSLVGGEVVEEGFLGAVGGEEQEQQRQGGGYCVVS
jgi:GTPase SAR1 family protein